MFKKYYCIYHRCYLKQLKKHCIRENTKNKKTGLIKCKHLIIFEENKKEGNEK